VTTVCLACSAELLDAADIVCFRCGASVPENFARLVIRCEPAEPRTRFVVSLDRPAPDDAPPTHEG